MCEGLENTADILNLSQAIATYGVTTAHLASRS